MWKPTNGCLMNNIRITSRAEVNSFGSHSLLVGLLFYIGYLWIIFEKDRKQRVEKEGFRRRRRGSFCGTISTSRNPLEYCMCLYFREQEGHVHHPAIYTVWTGNEDGINIVVWRSLMVSSVSDLPTLNADMICVDTVPRPEDAMTEAFVADLKVDLE
jgi:hypothetical protein